MMKVNIPVEAGNASITDGSLATKMQRILGEIKPEAAYFTADNGQRTGYIFFDLKEAKDIPGLCEPFFLTFKASIDLVPVMTPEDLGAAGPGIAAAVKSYT